MAIRHEGWETALFDYIRAAKSRPFVWGRFDCCLFPADVILAMTGIDIAADFRGRYSTATGAMRLLKKSGGDLDGLADRLFPPSGIEPLPSVLKSQRGDILRLRFEDRAAPFGGFGAVCLGPEVAFLDEEGLKSIPLGGLRALDARGWRV